MLVTFFAEKQLSLYIEKVQTLFSRPTVTIRFFHHTFSPKVQIQVLFTINAIRFVYYSLRM